MTTRSMFVIFDLDGTLALNEHRQHFVQREVGKKDWRSFFAACGDDEPIPHICRLARNLDGVSAIVYVSGRSDQCRAETLAWLERHKLPVGELFMRKAGDYRNDDIVKAEMLADVRAAGYVPIMAFDDRDRVVAAWRANGVPCAQVAPGDF